MKRHPDHMMPSGRTALPLLAAGLLLGACVSDGQTAGPADNTTAQSVPVMNVTPLAAGNGHGAVTCVVPRLAADRVAVDHLRDQQAEVQGARMLEADIPEPYDPLELEPTSEVSIVEDTAPNAAPSPPPGPAVDPVAPKPKCWSKRRWPRSRQTGPRPAPWAM